MSEARRSIRSRPGTLAAIAAIAVVCAIGVVIIATGATRSHSGGLPRAAPAFAGGPRRVGRVSSGTIRFALNLRLQEHALDAYLQHVRPGAQGGGLTASRFGARFGQSLSRLAQLRTVLNRLGIAVDHLYPQRTAMIVHATVPRVERLFALHFDRFALPDGRRYFAPEAPPRIPPALAPYITGLGDLSDHPLASEDIPSSGLTPTLIANAYDIAPLWNAGIRGQGETLAIATASGAVNPADLQAFAAHTGARLPQIDVKQVDGGSHYDPARGSDTEVDLDLQVSLGILPEGHIIDYQGPDGSAGGANQSFGHSLADIYNQIEQDGLAHVVTTSYGLCESVLHLQSPGDQQLIDNSLKALDASNVTVFESTGDSGAFACLQALQIQPASKLPPAFEGLSVQTPSSTPYAVAVGGTRVELRSDGSYLTESAWANPLARDGGGGGVSDVEPRPTWQQGPGVSQPALNPKGLRQTPDVAGPADPNSGFLVCVTDPGASHPTCGGGNGGTSAAAPFWAASMVLVEQYAAAHGAGALAHCFAGPILYDLAAARQPVPAFHQVTLGNNGYYPATPGWNFATGLGSPDVFNLAQDYANLLRHQPSGRCPF
ncbi:MAG TPA: S53 family peptidase [Solirubrobacteraceae bacterium]|nr:S53 family peptidase [Solirubrobacteraceae bacterium]